MRLLAGIACALAVASGAHAQVSASSPSTRTLDLARQVVFASMDERTIIDNAMKAQTTMTKSMAEQFNKNSAVKIDAEKLMEMVEPEEERAKSLKDLLDRLVRVYAESYSEADLQGILDFYSTPAGKSMIAKAPLVQQNMQGVMMAWMTDNMAKVREGVRVRIQDAIEKAKVAKPLPAT